MAAAATEAAVAITPRTTEALPAAGEPSYDEGMNVQPRMVLLVEDEKTITVPLTEALAREGFRTETAGTLAAGLRSPAASVPTSCSSTSCSRRLGLRAPARAARRARMPVIMLTAAATGRPRPA
jgi:ActR/RegA family two-component response regulator